MSFLTSIKEQFYSPHNHYGNRGNVIVSSEALRELLYHFEMFESWNRVQHIKRTGAELEFEFVEILKALYLHNGKKEAKILLLVMDVLHPLLQEKEKEQQIINQFEKPYQK